MPVGSQPLFHQHGGGSVQVQAQVSISGVPTYLNDQANPGNNFVTIQFVVPPPSLANSLCCGGDHAGACR